MTLYNPEYQGQDDVPLNVVRMDISGGSNSRQRGNLIGENQVVLLYNADIGVPGKSVKRPGLTLAEDLSDNAGVGLFGYEPDGGTNLLVAVHGAKLETYTGSGTFTERKTDFTTGLATCILKVGESGVGDVFVVGNGTDNWFLFEPADLSSPQDLNDTDTSPPKSNVACYYRNRLWVLADNLLYYSDAYPADYGGAFDRVSNAFRLPVGTERAVLGLRDQGLVIVGADEIWGLNPTDVPAATDLPQKILDIGCVASKSVVQVNDDIFFLASDGVRGVFRTQQDKLQMGQSFPLSYPLKTEYDTINWAYAYKAAAAYWDNKYFIALPTGTSTYNNQVWVYWPATQGWSVITGWNVASFATVKFSGQERLYCIDSNDGSVYRAWYGYSDNGTAINYQEEGRYEDLGKPYSQKSGGALVLRALAAGDYNISIYYSLDEAGFTLFDTMNVTGNSITLPVTMPFTLANPVVITKKMHLDNLGPWENFQYKLQHNATNGSDDITILERAIMSFPHEYMEE